MTGLDWQYVPITFNAGEDTKTDPRQMQIGGLTQLTNGIFRQTGALNKRWGYDGLLNTILGGGSISSLAALNTFQQELLSYDGMNAYSFSKSNDAWISRGTMISVIESDAQIVRNNYQQSAQDFGTLNGVEVYAWNDSSGGCRYSVFDGYSKTLILDNQPIYQAQTSSTPNFRPKVLGFPAANKIVILFTNGSNINYVEIDPAHPLTVPPTFTTLITDGANPTYYDATVVGNQLFIAYYSSTTVNLIGFNSTFGSRVSATVATVSPGLGCITVIGAPTGDVWVVFADNGATSLMCSGSAYSPNLATRRWTQTIMTETDGYIASIGAVFNSSAPIDALNIYVECSGRSPWYNLVRTQLATAVSSGTAILTFAANACPVLARGIGLASKPFVYQSNVYINAIYQDALQPTYFTLNAAGVVIAKDQPWTAGTILQQSGAMMPECVQVSTGVFKYANLAKGDANTGAGSVFQLLGVNACTLDFKDSNQFASAEINQGLYTVGGIVQSYDGAKYVEHGFHVYPNNITSSTATGGSGAMNDGYTYQYVVTYEWNDHNGNTQISTPSVALPVVVPPGGGANNASVTLTIPMLRLTARSDVRVVVYRNSPTIGGTLLFRVSPLSAPLYNVPTLDNLTFLDNSSDASIQSNGLLYTQPFTSANGGANPVLANFSPPACSFIATYASRIFLGGLSDPNQLLYSKQVQQGVPVEFAAENTLQVDPKGGPITALGVLNSGLIIFKQNSIFILSGNGPTNTGEQNDFLSPGPVNITSDVGCIEPLSVVTTPSGLMFKSMQGICLLDQSLQVSYIGAPVEARNNLTITSATLVPSQWVIFTTTSGTSLVYDYLYNRWDEWTNQSAIDSALWLGDGSKHVYANPNGFVFEQATSFQDAGAFIPLSFTTGNINLSHVQGIQRIRSLRILGTYKSTHTLTVKVTFDSDPSTTQTATVTPSAADGVYQYQVRLKRCTRIRAIQIQIQDAQVSNFGEGFSLSSLELEVGVMQGGYKPPTTRQFPTG